MALVGARLHPRFDIIMQYLQFETLLREADLVVTAEEASTARAFSAKCRARWRSAPSDAAFP